MIKKRQLSTDLQLKKKWSHAEKTLINDHLVELWKEKKNYIICQAKKLQYLKKISVANWNCKQVLERHTTNKKKMSRVKKIREYKNKKGI